VDFNADGHTDIVTGTYDGSPHVALGSKEGFKQPSHILDSNDNRITLDMYWDHDKSQWISTTGKHCTSAAAFDWDNDGDYDLLLGDYNGGHLYLRVNAGTNAKPKFSTENVQVKMIGDIPFSVKSGMSAMRLADWNGDGLVDLVCGGKKGGVFFYRNTGKLGAPTYALPKALVKAGDVLPDGPKFPNDGCHVEVVDYDDDGDLDLLVGGYSTWQPQGRTLSDEETQRLADLDAEMEAIGVKMSELYEPLEKKMDEATSEEERDKIFRSYYESDEMKKLQERQSAIWGEITELRPFEQRQAGVWVYQQI